MLINYTPILGSESEFTRTSTNRYNPSIYYILYTKKGLALFNTMEANIILIIKVYNKAILQN